MSALETYLERKNFTRKIFGQELLELPKHALYLHGCIENDLSPENLTCDGELSRSQVNANYAFLTKAQAELEKNYADLLNTDGSI